jgi:rfaE bifunctional protein kinase chain/domain
MNSQATGRILLEELKKMNNCKIAVIGDVIADEFVYGSTERISREAPVLILRWQGSTVLPGGAGNAARNVGTLGGQPISLGVIGRDELGEKLTTSLQEAGVDVNYLQVDETMETVQKTRILSGGTSTTKQQVIRIDRGGDRQVNQHCRKQLLENLKKLLPEIKGVLVSDYDCGLLDREMVVELNQLLADFSGVKIVDSRYNMDVYSNFTLSSPNEEETLMLTGFSLDSEDGVYHAGHKLLTMTGNQHILLTRGSSGMALFSKGEEPFFIPITRKDEIADVTGAGDTVAATVTVALASGVSARNAALLANIAGGLKVRKRGTATVSIGEMQREICLLYKLEQSENQGSME